ncbi:phage holin family protein [Marinihelvus fidelis]|uniref:Phage holin family protein n=1 Tax=Marinihelvus fidelis TaxID=2613842 RepID=A0A5N0TAU9_9GAMM|nr:phage holin family protein [Marinihelvus fidelis]KAA9131554.1 phage holin family protein [Marinihelvus fidelis]
MGALIGAIIAIAIAAVVSGVVIWVVSKLNLGLKVDGFGAAIIAGLVIGILSWLVGMFVPGLTGIVGAIINLVIAAAVIYLAGSMLKGLTVNGFGGAFIAAVAIALIQFLLAILLVGAISTT